MDWLTDERLFYGGMILAAAALVVLVLYGVISHIASRRLKKKLIQEYGEPVKRKK